MEKQTGSPLVGKHTDKLTMLILGCSLAWEMGPPTAIHPIHHEALAPPVIAFDWWKIARFKHCGAWCLFDYDEPDKVSYAWDDKQQCWKQGGGRIRAVWKLCGWIIWKA